MDTRTASKREEDHQLSYALTDNNIKLPVLDITHLLFSSSIDETALDRLATESVKQSRLLRKNPILRFLAKRSLTLGEFLPEDKNASYVSGMSTLMMKMGPGLVGGGIKRVMDRRVTEGFVAVTVRMRLRDICRIQAEALTPTLRDSVKKKLCFINIAGGSASDSINTLILIQEQEPQLLMNRAIEINVLDLDTFGPNFANRSIKSLKDTGGRFQGLDISFRHIPYDWKDTTKLDDLLSELRECIQICTSEGGLFEYGTDADIIRNLECLYEHSTSEITIVGDVVHELTKVNPAFPAAIEGSNNKVRFIGTEGLKKILEKTSWTLDRTITNNPIYAIFTLKKQKQPRPHI